MSKQQIEEIVTKSLLSQLEKGIVPWVKPWHILSPKNLVSKRDYQGINWMILANCPYASPWWCTFNQAKKLGGSVRQGEHPIPVVFWELLDYSTAEEEKFIPFLKYYNVFNIDQCAGIQRPEIEAPVLDDPIEQAEQIVRGMPHRPELRVNGTQAYYSPAHDYISTPPRERFQSQALYYSVLFHELCHSTGHASRLNRSGVTDHARFGSHAYSQEELVAEIGSAFLCGHSGIDHETIQNQASYIRVWRDRLHEADGSKVLLMAASQAQKAVTFIRGVSTTREEE